MEAAGAAIDAQTAYNLHYLAVAGGTRSERLARSRVGLLPCEPPGHRVQVKVRAQSRTGVIDYPHGHRHAAHRLARSSNRLQALRQARHLSRLERSNVVLLLHQQELSRP